MERVTSRSATFSRALVEFAAKANEFKETAVDGRSYVLVEKLRRWMRDTSPTKLDDKFVTNTDLLAHAAYHSRNTTFPPIEPSLISDAGDGCCVTVFCILLDLELGHLIHLFSRKTIVDRRLPEDLSSLKRKLRDIQDGEQVAERFNERQWKFCPAIFSLNMENEYFENRIIPICRESHLNTGGTAKVRQIVVQSEFVDKKLKNLLEEDAFASYDDKDYGPCYIFALKTFEEGKFQYYYDEKDAFDALRQNRGVIRRLGCYSHRLLIPCAARNERTNREHQSVEGKDTLNLLLEYGTYDLRLIFGHQLPPVFPKEILAFWEALFEVADAVSGIHEFKTGGSEFNGWHADIKPENIICVRGKYKLADPGFARFKKKAQDRGTVPQIRIHGGTDTYGAPEVSSQATVHQTIDTWSLGCVFSMAATWVILGYPGVCQYQIVREKALGSLLKTIKEDSHPLLVSQRLTASTKPEKLDCFHNGTGALSEVTSWHALLKNSARKSDPITAQVLNLIDEKMLLRDPEQRIGSKSLCEELKRIVKSSKKIIRDTVTAETPGARGHRERMESLLYEIDKEAATQIVEETPPAPTRPFAAGLPVDRAALKVQLEHVALKKTSHRFETISGPRPAQTVPGIIVEKPAIVTSDTMGVKEVLHQSDTQSEPTFMSASDKRRSNRRSTLGQPSRTNTGTTSLTYQRTGLESLNHATQNAIQARERMDRESKRKGTPFGGMMAKKKPRKDEYLSKHFKDRDIKFLVDDAETMSDHWDEATFLLETLVMKAHGQDPDGPDLTFTNHPSALKKEKDAAAFRRAMEKVRPKKASLVHTNIKRALEPIFLSYLSTVNQTHDKSKVNALTVIVLTDGLWEGMVDKNEITGKIVQFNEQLTKKMDDMMKDRQVSIQFIQFGDDEEARERLRRLDDDMPYHGVSDMIDFETFSITGNVFKMLLGSFVEEMDAINDSVEELLLEESPPLPATGFTPTKSLPLRPISEELRETLPSPAAPTFGVQPTPSPTRHTFGAQQPTTSPREANNMQQTPSPPEQPRTKRHRITALFSSQS